MLGLMAVVAAGLGAGCIEVEQSLGLERDLSGTAGVVMRVNLEPMAAFMARMQREMSGKTGEPTRRDRKPGRRCSRRAPGRRRRTSKRTNANSNVIFRQA
ncbi:MAG: hypothetical protein R2752_19150 [Vicinamibacterales bacterium]